MPKIIFIAGLMCAGKTTVADILTGLAASMGIKTQVLKFADPIYRVQNEVYKQAGLPTVKNRGLMQAIGDMVRTHVGTDYYEKVMEEAISRSLADLVIIDDMRFPGELDLARKLGAYTVQVVAPYEQRKHRGEKLGTWSESSHNSEMGLPDSEFDQVIVNDGDLKKLDIPVVFRVWAKLGLDRPLAETTENEEAWEDLPDLEAEYVDQVATLLQDKYGISIDDTNLQEQATEDVVNGVSPAEAVSAYAEKHGLQEVAHG